MIKIVRTDSNNQDFIALVEQLDAYLKITDGNEHEFYNQFNGIDTLHHVVVIYNNNKAIACGAFKKFNTDTVEIKRMFVSPSKRQSGIGKIVLKELESWASEEGFNFCILETGKRQTEAVQFYKKCNYKSIPKYGQYKNMDNSLCFEKKLMRNEKSL
ncbi:MAG: GNAT family N-acetyltransferase [Bacteroidia bacterium]|nr:GNAT family N-acetyltransferase [Bacteroidia bacterium]NNL81891.1 GNAT family N-acetyltransferase [Winogradskyella sp.]